MAVDKKHVEHKKDELGEYEVIILTAHDTSNCLLMPKNISGIKTNCCPFCDTKTFSGSWAPETCPNCKAYFLMDTWVRKIK